MKKKTVGEQIIEGLKEAMVYEQNEKKEQRAARIEQIKVAMLEMVRKHNPEVPATMLVELSPDAAIDLFTLELIDAPEEEFNEFLESMRSGTPIAVAEEELDDESRRRLAEAERRHR